MQKSVNGILLIYHLPISTNASTIYEHIVSFKRHSEHIVYLVNTLYGFPKFLNNYKFSIIVFHYSLFGLPISISNNFIKYVNNSKKSYKIAFLQDEHRYWPERSNFLNSCNVNCVYTHLEENWFEETYRKKTSVEHLIHNIPGYVSLEIENLTKKYFIPDDQRTIDVGYRGRRLPYYMGKGSQEKHIIGIEFKKRAKNTGLSIDIETDETKRLYGKKWPLFLRNCKAVLGVEAGVSVFDINDEVRPKYAEMVTGHPDISFPDLSFEEVHQKLLKPYEDKIYYRTISPRHFEAAALKNCQILFEGKYSGIMEPMKHYLPLKKDFSNFETVINLFNDSRVRHELTENAYNDLIASGKYTYKRFIREFDNHLALLGFHPNTSRYKLKELEFFQKQERMRIHLRRNWVRIRSGNFPGRKFIAPLLRPIVKKLGI